jgi:hypothetical protein
VSPDRNNHSTKLDSHVNPAVTFVLLPARKVSLYVVAQCLGASSRPSTTRATAAVPTSSPSATIGAWGSPPRWSAPSCSSTLTQSARPGTRTCPCWFAAFMVHLTTPPQEPGAGKRRGRITGCSWWGPSSPPPWPLFLHRSSQGPGVWRNNNNNTYA